MCGVFEQCSHTAAECHDHSAGDSDCVLCSIDSGFDVNLQMYFHISNNATILLAGWQTSTPWRKYFTQICRCVITYN